MDQNNIFKNTNFTAEEFTCKCGCGQCNVDRNFINVLQLARELSGVKYKVISGCRCETHNEAIGGSEDSSHISSDTIKCKAVDVYASNSYERFRIVTGAILAGFKRIGFYRDKPNTIHLDTDTKKVQEVFWL